MTTLFKYTVKSGDGYLSIAKHIFSQSSRSYIQGLTKRYDLMKEAATKIETDLKQQYFNFKLSAGQILQLKSDPSYYIPRLSLTTSNSSLTNKAKQKAKTTIQNDEYFVIHSTDANIKDDKLNKFVSDKKTGGGHAYVNKQGTVYKIWEYNDANGWATRSERSEYKADLRGKLVNIELVYGKSESPTEAQYQALADIYIETKNIFKKWLPIAAHREIDRGIPGGHSDPKGFDFDHFYTVLKTKKVPIETINKQSQIRFNQAPWCEHKWAWPPVLTGTTFLKVTDEEFVTKGCN